MAGRVEGNGKCRLLRRLEGKEDKLERLFLASFSKKFIKKLLMQKKKLNNLIGRARSCYFLCVGAIDNE